MVFVSYLQILFYNTTKLIWVMFNLLIVYFAQIEILWLSLQSEVQTEVRRLLPLWTTILLMFSLCLSQMHTNLSS